MLIIQPAESGVYQRGHDNFAVVPVKIRQHENKQIKVINFGCFNKGEMVSCGKLDFIQNGELVTSAISLPAGGWLSLELTVTFAEGNKQKLKVLKFGIGEVFIASGQSNSANWGMDRNRNYSGMVSAFDGENWLPANDPMPICDGTGGSIWPLVGDMLYDAFKVPVGFMCIGVGGSEISEWSPENENGLYKKFIFRYIPRITPYGCRALLWHHGESNKLTEYELYYDGLKKLISSFCKDFGKIPWLVALVGNKWENADFGKGTRKGQQQIIDEGLALPGPDTDQLGIEYRCFQSSHFISKGLRAHAQLWFQSILQSFFPGQLEKFYPCQLDAKHVIAVKRHRRIINQEDGNMPVKALGMNIDKWLEHRFDLIDTSGCQVDTISWDIGFSEDSYAIYNSKLLPRLNQEGLNKWHRQGVDWVERLVDESHKRGLETLWSHRVCPVDFPQPDKNGKISKENYLKKVHPDWVNQCWWENGLWNLANLELRAHKLKVLREIIELYDFDGFELDFARHTPCLPPGQEWENREHATNFIREVRDMLLEMEKIKNTQLILAVRVAENIEGCHADGFDVEKWAQESLIDIFILGGRTSEVDLAAFKYIIGGRNIKICPSFDGHHTNDGYYFPPIEYYRGIFSNWWHQGADSVSVFNWTCAHESKYDELELPAMMKCPSQRKALFECGSLIDMADKNMMHAVERRGGYPWAQNYLYKNDNKPLPCKIDRNVSKQDFSLIIEEKIPPRTYQGMLYLIFWRISIEDIENVFLNDSELDITGVDNEHKDCEIYCDRPQPACGFMAWSDVPITPGYKLLKVSLAFDVNLLIKGKNVITLNLSENKIENYGTIEKIEIMMNKQQVKCNV